MTAATRDDRNGVTGAPPPLLHPAPLAATGTALRNGSLELSTYLNELCDRIDEVEPWVYAFVPEENRRARLLQEGRDLEARFPDPATRPPLYGVPVGVKDVFHADGFPTRAGARVPVHLFPGAEAVVVTALRRAGALIVGKTVTTEFAFFEPGPTRNPHNPDHSPGGSSSGSAAAIAAGMCLLALGTQTYGSVIRPAAFCGVVGFKPGYNRVSREGLIPLAPSLDHVGWFTQDVAGASLVASLLCQEWQSGQAMTDRRPVLGVPQGPYLEQAPTQTLDAFEQHVGKLVQAGYSVKYVEVLTDIESINRRQQRLAYVEAARVHADWFARYADLYSTRLSAAIREGQQSSAAEADAARAGRETLRSALESQMAHAGIDLWITPAAPGPAPKRTAGTGDPIMNVPWTQAGLPTIALPAGRSATGMPLAVQCVAPYMQDEALLAWAGPIASALEPVDA